MLPSFCLRLLDRRLIIDGLTAKSTVAIRRRYGTRRTKTDCDVLNKSMAPSSPPIRLEPISSRSNLRSTRVNSRRYAITLAIEPGQSATVLVAFAMIGETPENTNAGKVKKLPPPATALSVPPKRAAMKRNRNCTNVFIKIFPRATVQLTDVD